MCFIAIGTQVESVEFVIRYWLSKCPRHSCSIFIIKTDKSNYTLCTDDSGFKMFKWPDENTLTIHLANRMELWINQWYFSTNAGVNTDQSSEETIMRLVFSMLWVNFTSGGWLMWMIMIINVRYLIREIQENISF